MREVENAGRAPARGKRKRKRKLSKFAYFLIFMIIAVGAAVTCAVLFLKVDKIAVTGVSPYPAKQIVANSGVKKGTSLFFVKQSTIEKNLCAVLPYIKSVKLKYSLPTTVTLEIKQDSPKFLFIIGKQYAYADSSLKGLEMHPGPRKDNGIITVAGAQILAFKPGAPVALKTQSQASLIKELAADISTARLSGITSMNVQDGYQLSVIYQNRYTIILGTPNGADEKLKIAGTIIGQKQLPSDKGTLDVSAQNKRYIFSPA